MVFPCFFMFFSRVNSNWGPKTRQGGLQYTREFHPMIHLARSPNIRYMNQVKAHEIMKIKSAIIGTCKGIGKSNFPIKIKIGPTTK